MSVFYDDESVVLAIQRLVPDAAFRLTADGGINWQDSRTLPSETDILAEVERATLSEIKDRALRKIDTARDTTLQAGLSYTMPDGSQETVQTRAQDEPNLLGLAIEARDLKAEGVTDPVLVLRVESNRNYQLTPQQMIELTDAAKNHKKLILGKSWQLKDAVDAALAAEDREAIEAIEW